MGHGGRPKPPANLFHDGFDVFYPRINWAGAAPGYVGTEIPLVPVIAALLYLVFGVRDWVGRAVSIAFFAASLPFLFLLVGRVYGRWAALLATAVCCVIPVSVFSARSFMPDTASLAFAIAAVWLFVRWLDHERRWFLVGATVAATVALLVKLAAVSIAIPMLALALRKYGRQLPARTGLWTAAGTVALLTSAWYLHPHHISVVYPPYHFFGSGVLGLGRVETYASVLHRIVMAGLTPVVVVLAIGGLVVGRGRPHACAFHWWLVGALMFVLPLAGGYHPWYALPFVPAVAGLAAGSLDYLHRHLSAVGGRTLSVTAIGFVFVVIVVLSWGAVSPLYESWNEPAHRAGMALRRLAPGDALIAVVDGGDPTTIYYSGRRGWHFLTDIGSLPLGSQEAIAELKALQRQGAHSLTLLRHTRWWLTHYPEFGRHLATHGRIVEDTPHYVIFALFEDG